LKSTNQYMRPTYLLVLMKKGHFFGALCV
jgi:hypothetical protein